MRDQVIAYLTEILGHEPSEDQIMTLLNVRGLLDVFEDKNPAWRLGQAGKRIEDGTR